MLYKILISIKIVGSKWTFFAGTQNFASLLKGLRKIKFFLSFPSNEEEGSYPIYSGFTFVK